MQNSCMLLMMRFFQAVRRFFLDVSTPWPLRAAVAAIALAYIFTHALMGFRLGPYDYDHLSAYYELGYRFWETANGFIPQYNPFLCGGRTLGADPQLPIYHPILFLVALVGPVWALRLEMLATLFLGTIGLIRMLRYLGLEPIQVLWGTLLFLGGGATIGRFLVGHVTLDFYFLYPVFLYLSYRLCENQGRRFWRVLFWYCLAFCYAGLYKPNFVIYGLLPLLGEALLRTLFTRSIKPLLYFSLACSFSGLIQSVSALPAWDYFSQNPRPPDHQWVGSQIHTFFANLVLPLRTLPKYLYGEFLFLPHEANLFIGPVALISVVLAFRTPLKRRPQLWALLGMGLLSLVLGLGKEGPGISFTRPFTWVEGIWPGFESIRVPVRFWYGGFFVCVVFSSLGLNPKWGSRKWFLALGVLPLVVFAFYQLFLTIENRTSGFAWNRLISKDIMQVHLSADKPYSSIRQGLGTIECTPNMQVYAASDLKAGRLLTMEGATGGAEWKDWNHIALDIPTLTSKTVRFNFNHSDLWHWKGEGKIVSKKGERLALETSASLLKGELEFIQPKAKEGLWLSVFGSAFLVLLGFFAYRKKTIHRIALTGSIASGKSTVATLFSKQGIATIDIDALAKEIREQEKNTLKKKFPEAYDEKDYLDNAELRNTIQKNSTMRAWYEDFMHRKIRDLFEKKTHELEKSGARAVLCEGSLLLQTGYAEQFDEIFYVHADRGIREERLKKRNPDWSESNRNTWLEFEPKDRLHVYACAEVVSNQESVDTVEKWVGKKVMGLANKKLTFSPTQIRIG